MFNSPVFPLRIGLVLAAALLLLGVPALSGAEVTEGQPVPTQSECANAYADSSAADTCSRETISVIGNKCRIVAYCTMSGGFWTQETEIETILGNVEILSNCNGYLRTGSCL